MTFVIPARRRLTTILFLPVWLTFWTYGGISVGRDVLSGRAGGLALVWMLFWLGAGGFVLALWLWTLLGRERVIADSGRFIHRYELLGFSRSHEYDVAQMKRLRVSPELASVWGSGNLRSWGWGGGDIAFDYGSKTVRFGAVDEAEADVIVERLAKRLHFVLSSADTTPDVETLDTPDTPEQAAFWGRDGQPRRG